LRTLDREQFVTRVSQHAKVGREGGERATRAVLQTLTERSAGGEARDLAERQGRPP
jgi:uncharacterized protein (DUF2267 family)